MDTFRPLSKCHSSLQSDTQLHCPVIILESFMLELQETLRVLARQALRDVYEQDLETFLFSHPAQIALLGLQFQWTLDTHVRGRREWHMWASDGDL